MAPFGNIVSVALASFLMAGGLLGFVAQAGEASAATLPACTTSSTATCAVTLTMTAGSFGVHGNTPASIPPPGSITGTLDPTTGAISGATLSRLVYHTDGKIATTSTETIIITQVTPGAGTGSINYLGRVSYIAALQVLVTIHQPIQAQCLATPTNVVLSSSTPYASGAVTIAQSNFTIPDFLQTSSAGSCGLATTELNTRYSGQVNEMSLSLTGALPLPPPPAKPSTTSLHVSPTGPVLTGTKVTLTADVSATEGSTPAPTGHVTFMSGSTVVGSSPLSTDHGTEEATLTTSALPAKPTQPLTAVYSGDGHYASSTSSMTHYSVQPKPTVSTNLPVTAIQGTATYTTFNVRLTNPSTGESWTNLALAFRLATITSAKPSKVTLEYENNATTWCSVTSLFGYGTLLGTFAGRTGPCTTPSRLSFSLAANTSLTVPFRVKFASNLGVGTMPVEFDLYTVNGSGTPIAPFTAARNTTGAINAPRAESHIQINPAEKCSLPIKLTPVTPVPQGYTLKPGFTPGESTTLPCYTTTTTMYPPPATGTVTFLVTGHTFTPPAVFPQGPDTTVRTVGVSTKGLSVGIHTLTAVYSGDGVYNPARVTSTFTVIAANPGTAFQCNAPVHSREGGGSVVASAALPATTNTGSAAASLLAVTVYMDGKALLVRPTESVTDMHISFAPGGSATVATAGEVSGGTATVTAGVSHVSATVSGITGSPGTVVPVAVSTISFTAGGLPISCTPVTEPEPLGSVLVSGVTLSASPASPAAPGTTVTLTAVPAPATKGGQVTFSDTVGGTKTVLGAAAVPTSGTTKGFATLTIQPPLGAHSYTAQWSGTLPASVSNAVSYSVETAPVVTTQPSPPTANLGQPLTFTAVATGSPVPTAAWQQSTDGGSTWTPATGTVTTKVTGTTKTSTLTIASATATDASTQFRAVFTNGAGTVTTNAVTPNVVIPPSVVTQPASQSVAPGSTGTFTAKATGTVLSVQWQVSTDGGGSWSNAPGTPKNSFASRTTITSTYTTPATTTANNGAQYRVLFTNAAGTATTSAATLTVTTTPPPPPPPPPPVTPTTTPVTTSGGYHLVASNGSVYSYGTAPFYGSMGGKSLSAPIVGTASTPGDGGYWLVGSDGGIFSFGNAAFYGSMGGKPLNQPIVGIAATPDGQGYWEVASDGGIFAFGDAAFYGSMGGKPLNQPIVGIASTPDGKGYWMVASDGGIFAFGDATFSGSTGSLSLVKPIVGMASTNNGAGYWLVAADGGVFSFGNAGFHGTVAGTTSASIVSLVPTADNGGYWETGANGQVFQFGDATSAGTALAQTATIVAMSD